MLAGCSPYVDAFHWPCHFVSWFSAWPLTVVSPLVHWSTVHAAECSLSGLSSSGPPALMVAPYSLNSNESGVGDSL